FSMVSSLSFFLFLSCFWLEINASFLTLLRRNWCWRIGEWVYSATGLRECDDVADGVEAAEQRDDTVPAQSEAAVWWRTVLERIQEAAELLLCFFVPDTPDVEAELLHISVVDTDGAAADFIAVADNVISVSRSLTWILIKRIHPLWLRRGKGVVHSGP